MDNLKQMVGVRNSTYPELTIGGRSYTRPATTCNLGHGKFCVLDNALSTGERDAILAELRAFVEPPKRGKKVEDDNEST